jgi:PTS system mannose-specific IID component
MTTPSVVVPTPAALAAVPAPVLPLATRLRIVVRLFAIQASWNYEVLMGTGIAFAVEPALRLLPGGTGGAAYRAALARQAQYFNAHPYLAAIAVGALARAELEEQPAARIERFRTALCGPLGSVGDRLVWIGLLPSASWIALALFGLGLGPLGCVLAFLVAYNAGHVALRLWGLERGWRAGLGVAQSLAHPVLRDGPTRLARLGTFLSGVAVPLVIARLVGDRLAPSAVAVAVAAGGAGVLVLFHGRVEGWRTALLVAVVALAILLFRHA